MGKKKKDKQRQHDAKVQAPPPAARQEAEAGPPPKMKRKEYEREMRVLHGELVAMQKWVKASGAKICVVFEGRDTARPPGHHAAQAAAGRRLRGAGPAVAVHPDAVLDRQARPGDKRLLPCSGR